MELRPARNTDLPQLSDIDGTVDSAHYLHVDRSGEGVGVSFHLEQRPLRTRLIERNPLADDLHFVVKQVVSGIEEGVAIVAEHEGQIIALGAGQIDAANRTMDLLDLRVDFDFRRQGIGSALLFQLITEARQQKLRAVAARAKANNQPAHQFLAKSGFDLLVHCHTMILG